VVSSVGWLVGVRWEWVGSWCGLYCGKFSMDGYKKFLVCFDFGCAVFVFELVDVS